MTSVLKVDNIQNSSGTSALSIDSSGRVTQPAKPAFSVYLGTQTSSSNYTSVTSIPFDTEDFDIGGNVTINSDAEFTAPVAGIYQFNLVLALQDIQSSGHVSSYLYINDTVNSQSSDYSYRIIEDPESGQYATLTNAALIQLNASDTINPKFVINADTSVVVRKGTRFSGFLVG